MQKKKERNNTLHHPLARKTLTTWSNSTNNINEIFQINITALVVNFQAQPNVLSYIINNSSEMIRYLQTNLLFAFRDNQFQTI